MPKSKRDKKVSLTNTTKKGLENKQKLIDELRAYVDQYDRLFIFSVENMRNAKLKDVRNQWRHSKFFFGKNKVVMVAFGRTQQNEYKDNLHKVSKKLQGNVGILFTNKTKEDVIDWFSSFSELEFARSGNEATETVILPEGPLEEFSFSMEPHLRQLGLPTQLRKGVIHLTTDHTVCKLGETLTPEQARILKLLGKATVDFKINIDSMWCADGTFEELSEEMTERQTKFTKVQKRSEGSEGEDGSDDDKDDEEDET